MGFITDFWTKSGSQYRIDDEAGTVACIGPDAFPPRRVDAGYLRSGPLGQEVAPPVYDKRFIVVWAQPDEQGREVLRTSLVTRIERHIHEPHEGEIDVTVADGPLSKNRVQVTLQDGTAATAGPVSLTSRKCRELISALERALAEIEGRDV